LFRSQQSNHFDHRTVPHRTAPHHSQPQPAYPVSAPLPALLDHCTRRVGGNGPSLRQLQRSSPNRRENRRYSDTQTAARHRTSASQTRSNAGPRLAPVSSGPVSRPIPLHGLLVTGRPRLARRSVARQGGSILARRHRSASKGKSATGTHGVGAAARSLKLGALFSCLCGALGPKGARSSTPPSQPVPGPPCPPARQKHPSKSPSHPGPPVVQCNSKLVSPTACPALPLLNCSLCLSSELLFARPPPTGRSYPDLDLRSSSTYTQPPPHSLLPFRAVVQIHLPSPRPLYFPW
jgi:hypothetical protein